MTSGTKTPFQNDKNWNEKIIDADSVWTQVQDILKAEGKELPETFRRPDVRLILNNISGHTQTFNNPGDHSADKKETVEATGDKTAAMAMIKGDTLERQQRNAAELTQRYNLHEKGLSDEFLRAVEAGECDDLVDEIYGPAPFDGQAERLTDVKWKKHEGLSILIEPINNGAAAFGAREADHEKVFLAHFPIYVKGTGTVPELVESSGMCIAISEDWKTKEQSTRPIVPSVAQDFYGAHYDNIPVVTLNTDGQVQNIRIGNDIITAEPPEHIANAPAPQAQQHAPNP